MNYELLIHILSDMMISLRRLAVLATVSDRTQFAPPPPPPLFNRGHGSFPNLSNRGWGWEKRLNLNLSNLLVFTYRNCRGYWPVNFKNSVI